MTNILIVNFTAIQVSEPLSGRIPALTDRFLSDSFHCTSDLVY